MKRNNFLALLLVCLIAIVSFGCDKGEKSVRTLRVYNWQDYIDEGLDDNGEKVTTSVLEDWAEDYKKRTGEEVEFVYNTFETNEYMLNVLKTGSEHYDLVCPSDYYIQKMISEDMLEKYNYNEETGYLNVSNYNDYGSPFVKGIFESYQTLNKKTNENLTWANYAIPYMWGTMGFVYDMDKVKIEDVSTWDILWNQNYAKKSTAKNSVHDTYVAGAMHVYKDELLALKNQYESSSKTQEDKDYYNEKITEIMNRFDDKTLELVEDALIEMKNNFYGFEVDNGKTDILGGTITINFAWGGDAVYSMDTADEDGNVTLGYAVPEEGSNVFFDGWVMPKGADVELAEDFINFMCRPDIAARNMGFIGYTSCIAGDEIWELINEWYAVEDGDEGYTVDLSYFFKGTIDEEYLTDGKALITVYERGRQFDAQYPTEEVLLRCGVMKDFGEQNDAVLLMWENVKCGEIGGWLWVGFVMVLVVAAVFIVYQIKLNNKKKRRRRFSK